MREALDRDPRREGRAELRRPGRHARSSSACRRLAHGRAAPASSRTPAASSRRCSAAGLPKFEILSQEIVGPVIGRDLQLQGHLATLASIVGITIYIALRFRPSFAIGAIVATLHDVLVTLAFLAFFGYDLSLNIVAAILTITGYSVNDTIVIFDRVRENMRTHAPRPAREGRQHGASTRRWAAPSSRPARRSCRCWRSSSSAARCCAGFAFTMLVGIVSGTYSTVFIASAIAIILGQKTGAAGAGRGRRPRAPAVEGQGRDGAPARKPPRDLAAPPRCSGSSRA